MDPRDELRPRLQSMLDDAHRVLDNAATMQRKLRDLTVSTRSEDGFVVTTVDARGRLVGLELDPRLYRSPNAAALANLILETAQRAVEKVEQDTQQVLKEYLPADMDVEAFAKLDFERATNRRDSFGR